MGNRPTIFVIDSDERIVAQIQSIATDMQVQCEAFVRAEEFLEAYAEDRAGCLVTEIRLMGINGIQLQETLAARAISLPFIYLTAHPETRLTVCAMRNGAITVLDKPPSHLELWDAMRMALTHNERTRRIDERHGDIRRRLTQLTKKERQVLDLLIQGKANRVIANRLGVSTRTVEARRHQIFKKTKTTSVAELVRLIVISNPGDSSSEL